MKTKLFKSVMVASAVTCVAAGITLSQAWAEDTPPATLQPGQQVQPADTETGLPEVTAEFQDGDTIAADTSVYGIGSTSNEFSRDTNTDSGIGDGPFVLYTKGGLDIHVDPFTGSVWAHCDDCAWKRIEGTVQQDSANTIILRFRLSDGIVAFTVSDHETPTGAFVVSMVLAREGAEPVLSIIEIPQDVVKDTVVSVERAAGRKGSDPKMPEGSVSSALSTHADGGEKFAISGTIFAVASAAAGCLASAAACQNDTLTAQNFCTNACPTSGCRNCCAALANDDLVNCTFTCGSNTPDNDYGNCASY